MLIVPEELYGEQLLVTIYGNSNDTKPTANIKNGSVFIETDTLNAFMFDETNTTWRQLA